MPGQATGSYRVGADVALFDANNGSAISGADLALAVLDEVEHPTHHQQHFSVAY